MKSVIVQGATVAKAIDEALVKAGMPIEFFIKILEEAQPGFLGFGSKKAKIALFFKKEQGRRDGSLLSRGSYKDLFDNENLSAETVQQSVEKKEIVVEKKEPVVSHPRKADSLEPQHRKPAPVQAAPQPRKVDTSVNQNQAPKAANHVKASEPKLATVQQETQKPVSEKKIVQRPLNQRPLNQRPLKFNNSKPQDAAPVLPPVETKILQTGVAPIAEDVQKTENQAENSQNKRPRRRRRYGYRSKAPIQWGKSEDDAELQVSDERHDS